MDLQWQQATIYYYEENKDSLILDCVQPLLQSLKPYVERAFFMRHWLRGPHLRVCFFTDEKLFAEVIQPTIDAQVGKYLREHPSTSQIDEQRLQASIQRIATIELEQGPLFPFYPDNSLRYGLYDRRLHVLSEPLANLIEQFYVESSELTFQMLEYIRQDHSRLFLALLLMFTTAHKMAGPIVDSFVSFRSHAERVIMWLPDPARAHRIFEQKYASEAEEITRHLRALLEALDEEQDRYPFMLPWANLLKRYLDEGIALLKAKQIDLTPDRPTDDVNELIKQRLVHSPFQDNLSKNPNKDILFADLEFQGYRLVLNLLYLHLTRLGIRPMERVMLGHFAANAVEEVFAVSAVDLVNYSKGQSA